MKKKILFVIALVMMTVAGSTALAQGNTVSNWLGTAWISVGQVVSAQNLKSNLDFLYDNKAPIPQNCTGPDNILGWSNDRWVCNQKEEPRSCNFNGTTVASGNSVTAYSTQTVPFGQTCASERRSCNNGTLSGTYQFSSCSQEGAQSCTFGGGLGSQPTTVAHNDDVTAFRAASVPFGQRCQSEVRSCTNGTLSGTYTAPTCVELPASSCEFNGDVVTNGNDVVAYQFENVPFGETCQSQRRVCTNGTLSGSYTAPACTVQPAATCVFNGNTLQNGETVEAFSTASVSFGQTCSSEIRTCSNGTLSGSNTFADCTVEPQETVRFYQKDFVTSSTEYYCTEEFFAFGETAGIRETPRDANNECPGLFNYERQRTTYHLQGHPGIKYRSNKYEGIGHDLASDSGTLLQLCKLKGYDYLVGSVGKRSDRKGFRTLKSPGNNSLTYGTPTARFRTTSVTTNKTFNGRYGWIECSNSPAANSGSGGSGGSGGGENNGGGRDINLGDNETR